MKKAISLFLLTVFSSMTFAQENFTPDPAEPSAQYLPVYKYGRSMRYTGMFEMIGVFGTGEWGQSNFGFNVINGIREPHYSIGIAIGGRFFGKANDDNMTFSGLGTVYLDGRYYVLDNYLSPYIGLGAGLVYGIEMDIWSGTTSYGNFLFNASAGLSWELSKRVSLNAGVIYECYKIPYDPYYSGGKSTRLSNIVGVAISLSLMGH